VRERRKLHHELVLAVLGNEDDDVAALQPGGRQPSRILAHLPIDVSPAEAPPHSCTLAADGDAGIVGYRAVAQQLGQRAAARHPVIFDRDGAQHAHQPTPK
jgi:hypothetical protein